MMTRWVLLCLLQGIDHSHIMRSIASGYGLDRCVHIESHSDMKHCGFACCRVLAVRQVAIHGVHRTCFGGP